MANIIITLEQIKDLVLPEGYIVIKIKTKMEKDKEIEDEIKDLEKDLGDIPTDEELIIAAKNLVIHPYYEILSRIESLNNELL